MASVNAAPLLGSSAGGFSPRPKPLTWFGYLPTMAETIPLDPETGQVDWIRVAANVLAGLIIGVRQTLSAIVSATLVFASSENLTISSMFPFGITMMWFSTLAGSLWYGIFGRLQYNTNATQEVCAILYGAMAQAAGAALAHDPEKVKPTVVALIVCGTVLTGLCALVLGKLGVGKLIERFPAPVTTGFLATIGWFLVKTAVQISSGVTFTYFYPSDWAAFCSVRSIGPVSCLLAMVLFMRKGPAMLTKCFPHSVFIRKLGNLFCQLFPLILFYVVVLSMRIDMELLSDNGWTYPKQVGGSFWSLWTTYSILDADVGVIIGQLPNMFSLVLMSVLCTMTGVLGIAGKFPSGPDGDPAPDDVLDFDRELTTVGLGSIIIGLANGVVTFHRLGSSIQLRRDGGTHRIGVFSSAAFVGVFFFSSLPLGHYIPKWFLGGLFMGSGIALVEDALFSFRTLPLGGKCCGGRISFPSLEYLVTLCCLVTSVFSSPFTAIAVGLLLCVALFLVQSSGLPPVAAVTDGRSTVSKTLRPTWELHVLREYGSTILVLYLQGQLFFGSGQALATEMVRCVQSSGKVRYCILSFAKVRAIDVSACDQLRSAIKKVQRTGCKVVCCRMDGIVFDALHAAQIVVSPDRDLRDLLEHDEVDDVSLTDEMLLDQPDNSLYRTTSESSVKSMGVVRKFVRIGKIDNDSFDHETDALDYCGDHILAEFCYTRPTLAPHIVAYRAACTHGLRLSEAHFESMNGLPGGTLLRDLRPRVEVLTRLRSGHKLANDGTSLYFILQGSLAIVDEPRERAVGNVVMKGFGGRGGKRLRKRYPPGNIVGISTFFLKMTGQMLDDDLQSSIIVSSKFSQETELWVLSRCQWDQLSSKIQKVVQDEVLSQLACERQHTLLSGE